MVRNDRLSLTGICSYWPPGGYWELGPFPHPTAFALQALYGSCTSVWAYTDIHYMAFNRYNLNVQINLFDSVELDGVIFNLDGIDFCNDSINLTDQSNEEGEVYFTNTMTGSYYLSASKYGYQTWTNENFELIRDTILQIELDKGNDPPPSEFQVSSYTGLAQWTFPESKDAYPLNFKIYLGDSLVAEPVSEKRTYQFQNLENGTDYIASISTLYEWGETEWVSNTFTTNFLGVDKYDKNTLINIYPNPANNMLNIDSKHNIDFTNIRIVNQLGQKVFSTEKNISQIEISDLDSGIYIVELEYFNKLIRMKIVIK